MADGFQVLCYTTDDPIIARRLKEAGATSVMPAGSPIGSGQGVLNPNNIRICLEYLKEDDPDYPVIVDAGVGTASDVTIAMELGVDGVLLNTGIAHAKDPLRMADAMRHATEAGRLAYLAGRIPKRLYATASSPEEGTISRLQVNGFPSKSITAIYPGAYVDSRQHFEQPQNYQSPRLNWPCAWTAARSTDLLSMDDPNLLEELDRRFSMIRKHSLVCVEE